MKKTISIYDFRDAFRAYDRYDTFSYEGYEVLFNFLEEIEEGCGEEWELDVIAICCDFSEDSLENILEETGCESLEELQDNTIVLHVQGDLYIWQAY